MDRQTLMC